MAISNVLQKIEPNYFPYQVIQSDDGGGNLVAYDENNPETGWTDTTPTPFEGLHKRVEFSDYYVNLRHNGTSYIEVNKELKSSSVTLYSSTEADTGLTDEAGNTLYCKTYVFSEADMTASTATPAYYIQLLDLTGLTLINHDINVEFYDDSLSRTTLVNTSNGLHIGAYSGIPEFQAGYVNFFQNLSLPGDTLDVRVTFYYTKP